MAAGTGAGEPKERWEGCRSSAGAGGWRCRREGVASCGLADQQQLKRAAKAIVAKAAHCQGSGLGWPLLGQGRRQTQGAWKQT